jgi:hypothetical protein
MALAKDLTVERFIRTPLKGGSNRINSLKKILGSPSLFVGLWQALEAVIVVLPKMEVATLPATISNQWVDQQEIVGDDFGCSSVALKNVL